MYGWSDVYEHTYIATGTIQLVNVGLAHAHASPNYVPRYIQDSVVPA